jgi:ribulose-5-phosphate 4-epimerase/fuculose-1-phosphate aldolase
MEEAVQATRAKIAELGAMLFDRGLTDATGGNLSARVGDLICITARHSGSKFRWQLRPEQVLVTDMAGNKLDGDGEISREAKVHFKLLNEFPDSNAVVHAHARHVMVFCVAGVPIPPVMECTVKLGEVKLVPFAPSGSVALADYVFEGMRGQGARIRKMAAAVMAPWHGLFVLGKDLDAAFDAAERVDTNARCILLGQALTSPEHMAVRQQALADAVASTVSTYE